MKKTFELLGMGKVATSAQEAMDVGFSAAFRLDLDERRPSDRRRQAGCFESWPLRVMSSRIARTDILVLGESAQAAMKLALHMMKRGGFISDHDELIGKKLAKVMSGGDLNHQTFVSEQYLLDLEREAFVSLCGERKTQERIAAMLKTGKPLRN